VAVGVGVGEIVGEEVGVRVDTVTGSTGDEIL
jgi:hypothetical protein